MRVTPYPHWRLDTQGRDARVFWNLWGAQTPAEKHKGQKLGCPCLALGVGRTGRPQGKAQCLPAGAEVEHAAPELLWVQRVCRSLKEPQPQSWERGQQTRGALGCGGSPLGCSPTSLWDGHTGHATGGRGAAGGLVEPPCPLRAWSRAAPSEVEPTGVRPSRKGLPRVCPPTTPQLQLCRGPTLLLSCLLGRGERQGARDPGLGGRQGGKDRKG